jgi:hypothetical protein
VPQKSCAAFLDLDGGIAAARRFLGTRVSDWTTVPIGGITIASGCCRPSGNTQG